MDGPLVSALGNDGLIVATDGMQLLLVDSDGRLVERIGHEDLPGRILGMRQDGNRLVLETERGHFRGDLDRLAWAPLPGGGTVTTQAAGQRLDAATATAIAGVVRRHSLTWERVLLDLHAGRLFGRFGPLAMDVAATGFMILAMSGLWLWLRHLRSQRQRRRRAH
jgi:hypothetical protein